MEIAITIAVIWFLVGMLLICAILYHDDGLDFGSPAAILSLVSTVIFWPATVWRHAMIACSQSNCTH
jgi:hypothetical protein